MSHPPINIFSCRIDPRGVISLLRDRGWQVVVNGPEDEWSSIQVTLRRGGWFRKPTTILLNHDPEYYDGPDWPRQVAGMQGYFAKFPDGPGKMPLMRAISHLRFALSVPTEIDIESDDERLQVVYAVCSYLDGMLFLPDGMRDAQGRVLFGSAGNTATDAVFPDSAAYDANGERVNSGDHEACEPEADDDEEEPVPPEAKAVAERALILAAVAARAALELNTNLVEDPDAKRTELVTWFEKLPIDHDAVEPNEWKVLQRPVGRLEQQETINSMWRIEGLVVLAWALQRCEMPPYDELVNPPELFAAMGVCRQELSEQILARAELRSQEQLHEMQAWLLALHWRLRDYSLRPQGMDFVDFSENCWFGSFTLDFFRVIDQDLAIGAAAIDDAPDEDVSRVHSMAMERHLAINWLHGDSPLYSETDTST